MTNSRGRTLLSGALLGALAAVPLQSVAQTVAWQPTPARVGAPATPVTGGAAAEVPPPAFLLNGAVDLSEGYTTNANGSQGTSGGGDSFTRGRLDLGLHYGSRHFTADAHSSLNGYYYGRFHDLNNLSTNLNFVSNAEAIPDHLFLNLNAFATPTELSRVGRLSTNGSLISNNQTQSYGYVATPTLRFRLGDYAFSQTSVSQRAVFFSQPSTVVTDPALPLSNPEDTHSISATQRIVSGTRFGRLRWGLTASYSDTQQTTQSQKQTQGSADFAYAVTRVMALLATVGYGQFTSSTPLTQDISGPTALGGLRISTNPDFAVVAVAGVSNGFSTYLGSLNWNPTPTFTIAGSLTDTIGLPQGNILDNVSTLAVSAEGVFSDARSIYLPGQSLYSQFATVSPISAYGLALDNSIYHSRSAQLSFSHHDDRNQYGVTFFGDMRDRLSVTDTTLPSRSSLYGVRINASRKLRRNLTGQVGGSYSVANEFGGNDQIYTADAGLTYSLTKDTDCYVTGRYLQRQSSGQIIDNGPFSDFTAIVGVRRSF